MMLLCCKDEHVEAHWIKALADDSRCQVTYSPAQLVAQVSAQCPDIILLDTEVAGLGGADVVSDLVRRCPRCHVFAFAAIPRPDEGVGFIKAGAHGYGNRLMHPQVLKQALRVVAAGELWLGSDLILHLIKNSGKAARANAPEKKTAHYEALAILTEREREIAELVAQGESNKRIAIDLGITERTVKAHLSSIYRKTDAHDRLQLALLINTA